MHSDESKAQRESSAGTGSPPSESSRGSRMESDAAASATAGAKACEGIVDGLNTMVDTVTKKTCVLSIEDGILTIREA